MLTECVEAGEDRFALGRVAGRMWPGWRCGDCDKPFIFEVMKCGEDEFSAQLSPIRDLGSGAVGMVHEVEDDGHARPAGAESINEWFHFGW